MNLYKVFTEQCFNLLRSGGCCGTIVPNGIYSDRGARQLRELLFAEAQIDAIIGLSNERYIFEEVHHAQKFCVLTFQKGRPTTQFQAAFRINPREAISPSQLEAFLHYPANFVSI